MRNKAHQPSQSPFFSGLLFIIGLLLLQGCGRSEAPLIQGKAWNFNLKLASDPTQSIQLQDSHGKVRVLAFWATWCTPCIMEIPTLNKLQSELGSQGLQIIGINIDEDPRDALPSYLKKMNIQYQVVLGNEPLVIHYGAFKSIPMTFIVGRQGEFIEIIPGLVPEHMLRARILEALAKNYETQPSASP